MVFSIILVLLTLRLAAEFALSLLNRNEVRRHAEAPPPALAGMMSADKYRESVAYTLAKGCLGRIELIWGFVVLLAVLTSGVLPQLYAWTGAWSPDGVWDEALFLILVGLGLSVPALPLEWWAQFRLEARFGFNKSTLGLWVMDKVKGLALGLVIGFPLLWVLLKLVGWMGASWWLWAFAVIFVFQLVMLVAWPRFIIPLFNKLTPLPEGELRDRLLALSERTGFRASTIEVIDGSKRSGHSNAFFTGFGRFRRIVLYDTLIAQLTPEELEAVLAHEVGHYKCGHIPRMIAVGAVLLLVSFGAMAWLAASTWFNPAFGFPVGEIAPAFLLFFLVSEGVTFWLSPLQNLLSRKHEYEADGFARKAIGGPGPLISALRKLMEKNLGNLTPHPWYSGFHYSHPTIVERERALQVAV